MTVEGVQFNLLDIVAAVYLLIGLLRGLKRGLSGELARLASMAFILFAGWRMYVPLGEKIAEMTRLTEEQSLLAGFGLIILAAGISMILLRLLLKNILEFTFKGKLEKIGGMVAGFLRSFVLIALIVIPLGLSPIPYLQRTVAEESLLGSTIIKYLVPVYQQVVEENPDLGLPAIKGAPEAEEPDEDPEPEEETE
jgi:uncharacterized membrane protein required for colicin V production